MSEPAEKKQVTQTSLPLGAAPAAGSPPLRVAEAPSKPPSKPQEAKPAEAKPPSKPQEAKPAEAKQDPEKPADAKPADPKPAPVKPADAKPAPAKPAEDKKPAPTKPPEAKPSEAKPAPAKPAEDKKPAPAKPADAKPADTKPAAAKPAPAKPADTKPASAKPTTPSVVEQTQASLDQRLKAQQTVSELRRKRSRNLLLKLALFVLVPTLAMTGYAGFIASDSYESVALFSIQAADGTPGLSMEGLMGLAAASPNSRDTLAAREYVLSREMLTVLDKKLGILEKYRSSQVDFFSRLPADASLEEAYEYYLKQVRVGYDSNSGVLTLRVRAFTADDAHDAGDTILRACEDKVNLLAERTRQDRIQFAEADLEKTEARLAKSREELIKLQQERGEFSPEHTAQAALSIRTQLEGEIASARAEYATLRSYMADTSPQVIAARQKVMSLSGQAQSENKRLVAPDAEGLNSSLVDFERVMMEKEFATHAYQSALASLEIARSDAARQHRYLATIADASFPDEAQYPRRFILVLTTFLLSLVLFGIGSLGWAAIKEHARLS